VHRHTKFHQNRTIRFWNIAMYHFVTMAAVCHFVLVRQILGNPQWVLSGLYRCTKYNCNRFSRFDNTKVWIACMFGLKVPNQTYSAVVSEVLEFWPPEIWYVHKIGWSLLQQCKHCRVTLVPFLVIVSCFSKVRDFNLPSLHLAPHWGWPCSNFIVICGYGKLESLGYHVALLVRS